MIQQDLFGDSAIIQQNPLTNRRVGFIGKFKNRAALVRKVIELGASDRRGDPELDAIWQQNNADYEAEIKEQEALYGLTYTSPLN